ncbi:MAG: hypothetical protein MNPFHGCM_01685 [Gemmatimonadaceae bacterium]|nr:hypothetical protein [Gemmatimonadaceae bacterium]
MSSLSLEVDNRVRDSTHDPTLRSWIESANSSTDFPVQNLPLGVFRVAEEAGRVGVAIGDSILDLSAAIARGLWASAGGDIAHAVRQPSLNALMTLGGDARRAIRHAASDLLRHDTETGRRARAQSAGLVYAAGEVTMLRPVAVGDYTDFYASVHHATNVGRMMRPDNPLLPNYKWIPIGYHGRASSIVVSGTPVRRPRGQTKDEGAAAPTVRPSRRLDYEAEVGFYVGKANVLGEPVGIADAPAHIFGICLLNDWSARDIQAWEYQPLGPFLAKSFATTVSPWVVTMEALEPFRTSVSPRPAGDPEPLPYLADAGDQRTGAVDLTIEVLLQSAKMREVGIAPVRLSCGNARDLYWTPAQLLAHHTSAGCNLGPGDLLGSGTVSGPERESRGCLLELTWRGTEPVELPTGETRRFLEDGDEVIMRGQCAADGAVAIGCGECRGVILPAIRGAC